MNKYNFDELVNRYNSSSSKYSEGKDVLPMGRGYGFSCPTRN